MESRTLTDIREKKNHIETEKLMNHTDVEKLMNHTDVEKLMNHSDTDVEKLMESYRGRKTDESH